MSRRLLFVLAAAVVTLALSVLGGETTWVQAYKNVTGADVAGILNSLQASGDIASFERFTDSDGDPAFRLFFGKYKAVLYMYGRTTVRSPGGWTETVYTSLQLYIGFVFRYGTPPSCTTINRWNREYRLSRAYIDIDGDPVLEADLSLKGGVAQDAIRQWILLFMVSVKEFASFINW